MSPKTVRLFSKILIMITLIFTMSGCGGNDRHKKYMKIVQNDAQVFDLVANIQPDSVVMQEDGTMTFNSVMERRDLEEEGKVYPIGTIHYSNTFNNEGRYLVEMIQASGENTFTNPGRATRNFDVSDLFQENDVFTVEAYSEFLVDGKMDNGAEFGYSIEVVSIDRVNGEYSAVIRVTRE